MTSPLEQLPNTYRAFFGNFPTLTSAQKQLIPPILKGRDIILQAGTGTGKTEAVLAPATENLIQNRGEYTIIYIVPTRALALDMNRRIKPIYQRLGLKAGIRTGDGKHLKGRNPDLLIMTPESLDVLLGTQNQEDKHFLKHVRAMIIDEVHVFIDNERGYQLAYLICRLERQFGVRLQIMALSATMTCAADVVQFFKLKTNVFCCMQPANRELQPHWVHLEDEELTPFFDDLYLRWGCKKILVFANTRKRCEELYNLLNQKGRFSQQLLLHYSNLSTKERKVVESSFRDRKMGVCIATTTLELGIDIGDVDGTVLMGPPPSTMAFLQRIGRSNRRQKCVKFWGVCQGVRASQQLVKFLALFEFAKENRIEQAVPTESFSVLFQQIVSCIYAKKLVSENALGSLFQQNRKDLGCIFAHMLSHNWLKGTKHLQLYEGGWRFYSLLKRRAIWSNFPPTEEEYNVIFEQETVAILFSSTVKQLKVGDRIQLMGKILKVLEIIERETVREIWVEESDQEATKELLWAGFGAPTSFTLAQKMGEILLDSSLPQGLFKRTRKLLEKERAKLQSSFEEPNGVRVHQLSNGTYRYETFLGTVGNFILYHLVKEAKIDGLSVHFDELGIESNEWIPFNTLRIPLTAQQFQEWGFSHLPLLRASFPWNSWLHWLPEEYQQQEINSKLLDPKVVDILRKDYAQATWWRPPKRFKLTYEKAVDHIELKGEPLSWEREKKAWESISFPEIPLHEPDPKYSLTGSRVQGYVAQKLCPRWARFQQLNYQIEPHPRFQEVECKLRARRLQGIAFKKEVLARLQEEQNMLWETGEFTWQQAIHEVIANKQSLLLAQVKLECEGTLRGIPDLMYIKYQESHICLEVWDIKNSQTVNYAQKWRIAFYSYLLQSLLQKDAFLLPVKISDQAGLVYSCDDQTKLYERASFLLAPYLTWMPRLIAQWKTDALRSTAIDAYSLEASCTSCHYFSYCYQETLFKEPIPLENQTIVSRNIVSNDFPKNTKQWFFIHYNHEQIEWQIWENGETISTTCLYMKDFSNKAAFRKTAAESLHNQWNQSVNKRKNPHFLVYEPADWHLFHNAFPLPIWAMHSCWTSIQTALQTHFHWPVEGRLTASQVAACIGIACDQLPFLSLYHRESSMDIALHRQIWNWCLSNIKSRREISFECDSVRSVPLVNAYLKIHHRETECRTSEILEFQKNPLTERVKQFRAIGPIRFLKEVIDNHQKCYLFSLDNSLTISKFRVGDFLKLAPSESDQIQDGYSVILNSYSSEEGTLTVYPLSQKIGLSKNVSYVLDENATDWNATKIEKVLTLLNNPAYRPEIIHMLLGHAKQSTPNETKWVKQWYQSKAHIAKLNFQQINALMLPFREKIGLIEGPPGTGKTYLLVWTLMALVAHAHSCKRSIKILVTAQTHHAIDQILKKVATTFSIAEISPVPLWKYGRSDGHQLCDLGIHLMKDSAPLFDNSSLILGATGFGVYQMLEQKNFPPLFDWVIFDESSQVLVTTALLSLIFGKGNALFYGDTQQLAPVLKGNYLNTPLTPRSILQELILRHSAQKSLRLNETYRMNLDICRFVSKQWYDNELVSAVPKNQQRLMLPNFPLYGDSLDDSLDPSQSITVVQLEHIDCQQSSEEEAYWIAEAVKRLMEDYAMPMEEIGIISPHRLQNNAIMTALKKRLPDSSQLPRVDTVERMQGAEFDIVLFSATVSDKQKIHSPFLKDYRRFNVAITRSRKKFIFVASTFFFQSFPTTEKELIAQSSFEALANMGAKKQRF